VSPRIVSLVPSGTETLLSLGAPVTACTRFCEQPGIPHVGGTKNPDIAAIIELDPDFVVMDREENRREDADALAEAGVELFVSDVTTVDAAERFVVDLAARAGRARPMPPLTPSPVAVAETTIRATAFVPIWRRPWMSINRLTYGADLLARLGVVLVTGEHVDPYPTVDIDEVAAGRPTLVLVPSEPYEFRDAHLEELRVAFGAGVPVVRVDGRDLFWWGSRTSGALSRLGAQLAPLIP
jgi:ABC-type Fe3+-hydroxamate transport system substrate-binding protein